MQADIIEYAPHTIKNSLECPYTHCCSSKITDLQAINAHRFEGGGGQGPTIYSLYSLY